MTNLYAPNKVGMLGSRAIMVNLIMEADNRTHGRSSATRRTGTPITTDWVQLWICLGIVLATSHTRTRNISLAPWAFNSSGAMHDKSKLGNVDEREKGGG